MPTLGYSPPYPQEIHKLGKDKLWDKTVDCEEILSRQRDTKVLESTTIAMIDFSEGFVCIPRGIRKHWIWQNAKYNQWWEDLVMMAAYEPGITRFNKHKVPTKRGEAVVSQRMLLHRWGTNGRMVKTFLEDLEEENIISREIFTSYTIVTISNFDLFQGGKKTSKKGKRTNANART